MPVVALFPVGNAGQIDTEGDLVGAGSDVRAAMSRETAAPEAGADSVATGELDSAGTLPPK